MPDGLLQGKQKVTARKSLGIPRKQLAGKVRCLGGCQRGPEVSPCRFPRYSTACVKHERL